MVRVAFCMAVEVSKHLLKKGTVADWKRKKNKPQTLEIVRGCDLQNKYFHLEKELFSK